MDFYASSNDELLIDREVHPATETFLSVANPHSLHAIYLLASLCRLARVVLIDSNASQIRHWEYLRDTLQRSSSRCEYISRCYFLSMSDRGKSLVADIQRPPTGHIRGGHAGSADTEKESEFWRVSRIQETVFASYYGVAPTMTSYGPVVQTAAFGATFEQALQVLSCFSEDGKRCPVTLAFGCGFLASEKSFREMQHLIAGMEITTINADIWECVGEILRELPHGPVALGTSNLEYRGPDDDPGGRIVGACTKFAGQREIYLVRDRREGTFCRAPPP